jgi:hypothetical protein
MAHTSIYMTFAICLTVSLHVNSQNLDALFSSKELSERVKVLIDSAKIELNSLNNKSQYDIKHLDTAQFNYVPVLNSNLSMSGYSIINTHTLSEILLIDKQSGRIIGAFHFSLLGPFATNLKEKYFLSRIPPREESRLHYIPQKCYKSLSKKLKNENSRFFLISVLETRSAYILREQQLPFIENRKEFPEPICE